MQMKTVVGVRFKKAGKIYYFDPGSLSIKAEDHVIVETARGQEFGEVVIGPREVPETAIVAPLKAVQRIATAQDGQKIRFHKLPMNLVDVEYTFDVNKIIFYFTAEGRIDFRELVKDLASVFRTRIELRQIGVRDEAKMMGGIGCCGRPLCCSTFLGDFEPVSIRMAKEQHLSLNPTKISGICGRLMCCLKYENDAYSSGVACKKITPPVAGREVVTIEGEGKVTIVNAQKKTATVQLQTGKTVEIPWEEVVEKE
jgi:cell fate regulator YaaT (PSP1 superfamily)